MFKLSDFRDDNGTLKFPLANEIDQVLYEELITMLEGNAATVYLEMNAAKSGIEAWRALNAGNDPKTYQQSEVDLQMKDNICKVRCKTFRELQMRMAELQNIYDQYCLCVSHQYDSKQMKHDILKVIPHNL